MTDTLIALAIPVMALAAGWWRGRYQTDPRVPRGRRYYEGHTWIDDE